MTEEILSIGNRIRILIKIWVNQWRHFFPSLSAPDHPRAKNNRVYYQRILQNRTRIRPHIVTDRESLDGIANKRPDDDDWEDRDSYEQLCRQNASHVKHSRVKSTVSICCILVECKRSRKALLSLSSQSSSVSLTASSQRRTSLESTSHILVS